MYIVSAILFLLPCSLLATAWYRAVEGEHDSARSNWRTGCIKGGLVLASFATLATMAFIFSWLYSGGDPHGLGPAPGPWQILRHVFMLALLGTLGLAISGKGKGRWLLLAWGLADAFVVFMVIMLDFD